VLYNRRGVSDYVLYDEAGILDRTGVEARQYLDYAALRGDPSDNLPGVPGIGEKTAAKLISTYGGLERIYEHLEELPPSSARTWGVPGPGLPQSGRSPGSSVTCRSPWSSELRQGDWDRSWCATLFDQLAFRTLWPGC